MSTLVYCIGPRLSQVEFSTVAVCVRLISQGQPSGKVCFALCLEWRAVYRHQPTVYREKCGQKEADLSSTGLGFWIIFIDFVDALWLCCWNMLMGWKARRTRCTYFKKELSCEIMIFNFLDITLILQWNPENRSTLGKFIIFVYHLTAFSILSLELYYL